MRPQQRSVPTYAKADSGVTMPMAELDDPDLLARRWREPNLSGHLHMPFLPGASTRVSGQVMSRRRTVT